MRVLVGIVLAILLVNLPFVSGQVITTSVSTSTSSTNTTQLSPAALNQYNKSATQTKFGTDTGIERFSYSATGFTMTVPNGGSFTLGLPTIVFASALQSITPTTNFQKNSSEYAIQVIGATSTQSSLFFIHFKNSTQYNQKLIQISGISSQPTTISFPLTFKGNPSNCDTNNSPKPCTQVCFTGSCFDWSDASTFSPSYNNQTHVITFQVSTSFNIDPLALDGSAKCSNGGGATCSLSLTTSNSPDVIVIITTCNTLATCTGSSHLPTASGLTFSARAIKTDGVSLFIREDYAKASGTLSALSITCNGDNQVACVGFGVSGADTSTIWDSNAALPCTSTGTSNAPSCTISTSNANDFLIEAVESNGATCTQEATFTLIQNANCNGGTASAAAAYKIVSATQSSVAITWSLGASIAWVEIADAIIQASATVTQGIKITTLPAGAPSGTISISGCAVSNSTFTANGNTKTYSSVTANCTITLSAPNPGLHSRYCWSVSPRLDCSTGNIFFMTCVTSPCATYSNNTYYQLAQNWTLTPQTPSTWDGAYTTSIIGTFLGVGSTSLNCLTTTIGGGAVSCNNIYFDYNLQSCSKNPIGQSWFPLAPNCFTDATANNIHNVNYIQSKASSPDFDWLLLTPVFIIPLVVLLRRRIR